MNLIIKQEYHLYFFCVVIGIPVLVNIIIGIYCYIVMTRPVSRKPTHSEKVIANAKACTRIAGKTLTTVEQSESVEKASKERVSNANAIEDDEISSFAQTTIPFEPTSVTGIEPSTMMTATGPSTMMTAAGPSTMMTATGPTGMMTATIPTGMTAVEVEPTMGNELQEDVYEKIAPEEEYKNLEFETPKMTAAEPTGRVSMKEATKAETDYEKFELEAQSSTIM